MRSKKSPVVVLALAAGLLTLGCREGRGGSKGPASGADPPAAKSAPSPPRGSRRLPAPLLPSGGQPAQGRESELRPCSELVAKVCALLSEGAEECGEARNRVERLPGTVRQERCAKALDWYLARVEQARHPRPCSLLAEVKCAAFGPASTSCVSARADVDHLKGELGTACLAELLLFKGIQ